MAYSPEASGFFLPVNTLKLKLLSSRLQRRRNYHRLCKDFVQLDSAHYEEEQVAEHLVRL